MKGTSKPRLPHLRPAHPHLRVRGWFLSENAAMPPGQQVKVHKSASFVDILEVCKFTTFCDRKGYRLYCESVKIRDLDSRRPWALASECSEDATKARGCLNHIFSLDEQCNLFTERLCDWLARFQTNVQ